MLSSKTPRFLKSAAGLIASALLSSCYETKQDYTINPDGSGKVTHECSFTPFQMNGEDETSQEALQGAVSRVIKDAKGVEAWNDVQFKRLDDGRIWFRGTAYFPKLENLEIPNQSMLEFKWSSQQGRAELTLDLKKSSNPKPPADRSKLTAEERERMIQANRTKFQQSKPMMDAMLGKLSQDVTFHLPGRVESKTNFRSKADNAVGLTFAGTKMIAAFEKLSTDDTWIASFNPQNTPDLDASLGELLFGEKAPVKAVVSGAQKPLFNYPAEVAEALKGSSKLEKMLGSVSIAPPAKGEPLKTLKVVGVQVISPVDKKLELRPFNESDAGYSLSVLAEFPGSILEISDKSSIDTATANDGTSLLKGEREWDRRLEFPSLSKDKASALFGINLKLPPAGAGGIKEISGVIKYRVAGGTKEVDLGFDHLATGKTGKELVSSIEQIKASGDKDGSQEIEIKVKLAPSDLKSAYLVIDGVKTELKSYGYSGFNGATRFTFKSSRAIPENGAVVLEIHDQLQAFDVPFKLENLPILHLP
jgi:hypothetical protein